MYESRKKHVLTYEIGNNIYIGDTERRPVDSGDDDARGFPLPT
jgi:hypothetical protein